MRLTMAERIENLRHRLVWAGMDRVTALLDGPRARSAFVLRSQLDPPWAMSIRDEAPLTVAAVVKGDAWIVQAGRTAHLEPGAVAMIVGPGHYLVTSDPALEPDVIIWPGQRCETIDGESLALSMRLGVRSWGHSLTASTVLFTGTYEHRSSIAADVLADIDTPAVVQRPTDDALLALLGRELANDTPGQQALLDRLLDALTVDVLRGWYDQQAANAPAWWAGHRDPIVGRALELLHDEPERAWTIASIARAIGVSRAHLARRFTDVVGEPIIAYLTRWRLSLAADLLTQPGATVTNVADRVGYASPYALSTAFKRRYGISPHQHRTALSLQS
jgi:AraC-like DNA-binding protein